jgi:hypothetical protein
MPSTEHKLRKVRATDTIRDITLTIPHTLEIMRKPGSATSHSTIMAANDTRFMTNYGIKTYKKKITCKNLGQKGFCLTNGIFNNLASLQSCGCQIK